jgi:hypothetical protein
LGRARYGDRVAFGVRVAFCAVATVPLVLAFRGPRASRHDPVTVYLNGSRVTGPPGSVMLTPHQEIAVTYRPGSGFRAVVPVGYAFPAGT